MASFTEEQEWYYLNDEAENLGPFNITEIAGFYSSSLIKDTTFVWHEDIKDGAWSSLNEVDGMIIYLKATTKKASGGETKNDEDKEEVRQVKPGSHGRRSSVSQIKMEEDKVTAKKVSNERRASMFGKDVKAPPAMGEVSKTTSVLKLFFCFSLYSSRTRKYIV